MDKANYISSILPKNRVVAQPLYALILAHRPFVRGWGTEHTKLPHDIQK